MRAAALAGRLLVATPALDDPNFRRTVVLVLEHTGADGALGLVLNRPTEARLAEVLPEWAALAAEPAVVFVGGPVSPSAALGLGLGSLTTAGADERPPPWPGRPASSPDAPPPAWAPISGRIGAIDLSSDGSGIERVRIFAGYAGWGPGQLETEIEAGAWYVVDPLPGDPFLADPGRLWRLVLRRQGGDLALVSTFPPDPALN